MKLIDTHTHLYLKDFANDITDVIERATNEGVEKFYLPAIDSSETDNLLALENKYPGKCFAMMGLHPCSVKYLSTVGNAYLILSIALALS